MRSMVRVLLMVMLCALLVTGGQAAEVGDTARVAPPPGGPIPLPYPTTIERGEPTIALAPATTGVFLYVEGIAGASNSVLASKQLSLRKKSKTGARKKEA